MVHSTDEILNSLISNISSMEEVQSIGISGIITPLPKAGEGDIDVFIYCDTIPDSEKRLAMINKLGGLLHDSKINVFNGGHWGTGDLVYINGVDTWLMYFTVSETVKDVEAILDGEYPDKLPGDYYPVGRCAMFKGINILYDKTGFLDSLKSRLSEYPDKLTEKLVRYHLQQLGDTENLERAVSRKEVLFYHCSIDNAIDHFLQALFAMNKTFFPSRKRTLEHIENFNKTPERCSERFLEVVKLGSCPEGIEKSYEIWSSLVDELKRMSVW